MRDGVKENELLGEVPRRLASLRSTGVVGLDHGCDAGSCIASRQPPIYGPLMKLQENALSTNHHSRQPAMITIETDGLNLLLLVSGNPGIHASRRQDSCKPCECAGLP
jgi:hypothetical protein